MLEISWITAILQLYSQVADLFGNVNVKRINIRLFDLLARFRYIELMTNRIKKIRDVNHRTFSVFYQTKSSSNNNETKITLTHLLVFS